MRYASVQARVTFPMGRTWRLRVRSTCIRPQLKPPLLKDPVIPPMTGWQKYLADLGISHASHALPYSGQVILFGQRPQQTYHAELPVSSWLRLNHNLDPLRDVDMEYTDGHPPNPSGYWYCLTQRIGMVLADQGSASLVCRRSLKTPNFSNASQRN